MRLFYLIMLVLAISMASVFAHPVYSRELSKREDAVSLPNIDIYPSNERPGGGRQVNDDVEDYEKQPNYGKGKINQLFEYVFENLNPKKLYNEKIKNSKWFKMIFE